MIWEDNDLLAVFDQRGNLINAALLRRPLSITGPNLPPDFWTEPTANAVFDGWDKQYVSLYHNANYDIKYYGLQINDSGHWYSSGKARIDIHKQEATNGCIFIVDGDTPPYPSADDDKDTAAAKRAKLDSFEPKLIQDIQKAIGAKAKSDFGIMRVIKIK